MPLLTVPMPDAVYIQRDTTDAWTVASRSDVSVSTTPVGERLRVDVSARVSVAGVRLRWRHAAPRHPAVLGDAWERSYGELEWLGLRAERVLPWTALVHDRRGGSTTGYGVEVRGGAFAFWQVDAAGISLVLDLRSGGAAVRPGERSIHAATVVWTQSDRTPFAAQQELYGALCTDPLPVGPLVGANNWYYAYGKDFDQSAVVQDARTIAELVGDHPVRPFGVIDDGWSPDGTADGRMASGGPWDTGRTPEFPAMPDAAAAIRTEGVRPGIWYRPLLRRDDWADGARGASYELTALDPSCPAVLDLVGDDIARIRSWGFDLVKHDFSTFELLGQWGPTMGPRPLRGPALYDPSMTTAEALVGFYQRLADRADGALILSCNVVGHLAAGLVHANRTGDDTSGLEWDRTRRVGVNTLAFRLAQHRRFFAVDADCVPSTTATDWSKNRQFLDLIARSGTVLFVSVDPKTRTDAVDADLSAALRLALDGGTPGGVEPLDWLDSPTPRLWAAGDAQLEYDWDGPDGADALEPLRDGLGE